MMNKNCCLGLRGGCTVHVQPLLMTVQPENLEEKEEEDELSHYGVTLEREIEEGELTETASKSGVTLRKLFPSDAALFPSDAALFPSGAVSFILPSNAKTT